MLVFVLIVSILPIGLFGFLYWYNHSVPEWIQIQVGFLFSEVGALALLVMLFLQLRRLKKVGNLVVNGQTKNAYMSQGVMWFLVLYCNVTLTTDLNRDETIKRNVFWWIVIICLWLYLHYSTEWRVKGFVYRGKPVPFSDVELAKWDAWNKSKLKIRLKNGQELALNIPLEITPAIDDTLRAKFSDP